MIHLRPYGMCLDIDLATTTHRPIPDDVQLSKAVCVGESITMYDETRNKVLEFRKKELLGKGAFSEVFATDTILQGKETVVKQIRYSAYSKQDIATEALTQILVVKATEHYNQEGPFAPHFFHIGADEEFCYLVSERMHTTLNRAIDLIQTPKLLMHIFGEVANILHILWETLQYNHRDLKLDNVMFDKHGHIRIVDFGFSCLKYGNLEIIPTYGHLRKLFDHCDLLSRDMKAFFYSYLYKTQSAKSCPLHRILKALMFSGKDEPANWLETYPLYNAEPNLPNMFPETIQRMCRSIRFVDPDNLCSDIDPSWVEHVGELNKGLLKMLTAEELQHIPKEQLLEYLKTYPSARLFTKILRTTHDEDVRRFCEQGLEDQHLVINTNTRKGGRRTKRKTRRA